MPTGTVLKFVKSESSSTSEKITKKILSKKAQESCIVVVGMRFKMEYKISTDNMTDSSL